MSAEVKSGYKVTEAGVIPKDWEVRTLQDICREQITYGIVQCGPHIPNGVPYIRVSDMDSDQLSTDGMLRTSKEIANKFLRSTVKSGDIVYALRGKLGEVRLIPSELDGANLTQGTARLAPKENINSIYLLWSLREENFLKRSELEAKGSTFREITLADLRRLTIPVPLPKEQTLIASTLFDMAALLSSLDQLIAKKRDIQQATMQQLLTGQRRLPGFSGEWEAKRLGDHLSFLKNGTNSRAELSTEGDVHYLHYGDIHGSQHLLLNPAKTSMPCLPRDKAKRLDRLENGDLVFADASEDLNGVGKSVEVQLPASMDLVSGLHTIAVRFDKKVMADGFKAYLQFIPTFRSHLRQLAAGTKVYATNRAHIASAELKIPGTEEQAAIASILADMETELAVLEERRNKARQLKQGMMQELLTGRIRLL